MNESYEDIIHLPHPVSAKRKRMSLSDRAAQFAPFAALSGFADAITRAGAENISVEEIQNFSQKDWDQLIYGQEDLT